MKNVIGMVACCALLGAVANLAAQGEDPMGPFDFSVKFSVATTDNRDSSVDGEANADFLFSPRVAAIFDMNRSYIDFFYQPSLRYRTDARMNQNDEELLHDLGFHMKHDITPRLTLGFSEDFIYTDDPAVERAGGTLRRDSSFGLNRVEGSVFYDINRRSRVEVDARHRLKVYDESALSALDESSLSAGTRAAYQVARKVSLSIEARGEQFSYEYDDLALGSRSGGTLDRGFTALSAGVGVENEFLANCRASLRLGAKQLDYEDASVDSETAPYVVAILKLASIPSTEFTVPAQHELRDADVAYFASQKYTSIFAGVEVEAGPRVILDFSGAYRLGQYEEDTLPSGFRGGSLPAGMNDGARDRVALVATAGDETAIIIRGGVAWRITSSTRLKLSHIFEDEDSDVSVSFTRNETILSLVQTF